MTHKKYKAYTLVLLMITITALVVTAAMLSLRRQADAQAEAAQTAAQGGLLPERTQKALESSLDENSGSAYYTPKTAASQESAAKGEEKEEEGYFITIYKGKLGVFKAGQAEPVMVREKEALLLPEADLRLLRQGLWAKDMNEVRKILEDYD